MNVIGPLVKTYKHVSRKYLRRNPSKIPLVGPGDSIRPTPGVGRNTHIINY